jgi:NAD/NADP transhydrogenase alpha subunit
VPGPNGGDCDEVFRSIGTPDREPRRIRPDIRNSRQEAGASIYVTVAVLKETLAHERRVALVPSVVPKLIKLGAKLHMQVGAGNAIKLTDQTFKDVTFIADPKELVADADLVLAVQPPALDVIKEMKEGAILVCFIYANREPALVQLLLDSRITCFAMERVPRISRAQAMDALSSQSALAGYYAVQLGATTLGRVLPRITTVAAAIGPAKVLVMGLGVAGLEALATAHRLGAVTEGYDVRPDTQEQALSAWRKVRRDRRRRTGPGWLCPRTDGGRKRQGRGGPDQAHPGRRPHRHNSGYSRPCISETY